MINRYFLLLVFLLVARPLSAGESDMPLPLKHQQHVLAERIYAVKEARFIDEQYLLSETAKATYILLGETHDNSRHHALQQQVMISIAEQHPSTSVSFEMIDDQQAEELGDLNAYDINTLVKTLQQSGAGWQYQAYYRDLLKTALDRNLKMLPANIERKTLVALMRNESVELDAQLQQWLAELSLSADLEAGLQQEIVDSHCGMLTAETAGPMVKAQRLRDIVMMQSLLNSKAEKRILIAGAGHVRQDRGVPYYLNRIDRDASLISLGLIEVAPEKIKPEDYAARWDGEQFPFDYVWFTARADREDPCLAFGKAPS